MADDTVCQIVMPESKLGHLISLDGDSNAISMQLRLLPPSPNILILPPLSTAIQLPSGDSKINIRSFIRHVHETVSSRLSFARSFLQSSSNAHPRLVFINGGCVSAQSTCLKIICDQVTQGNIREAKELFLEIVNDGVAGLMRQDEEENKDNSLSLVGGDRRKSGNLKTRLPSSTALSSRVTNTALEIPDEDSEDDSEPGDLLDYWLNEKNGTAEVASSRTENGNVLSPDEFVDIALKRVKSRKTVFDGKRSTFGLQSHLYSSTKSIIEEHLDKLIPSPWLDKHGFAPPIPNVSGSEERHPVTMKSTESTETVKKTKSDDRFAPRTVPSNDMTPSPLTLKKVPSMRYSSSERMPTAINKKPRRSSDLEVLPRTTYIRPLSRTFSTPLITESSSRTFMGRRASSGDPALIQAKAAAAQRAWTEGVLLPFEPVFSVAEDVVIFFNDGTGNEVWRSVIQAYKNGSYPLGLLWDDSSQWSRPSVNTHFSSASNEEKGNPVSHGRQGLRPRSIAAYVLTHRDELFLDERQEDSANALLRSKYAGTPPAKLPEAAQKFYEFDTTNADNAWYVQNSLRALLHIVSSAESTDDEQNPFSEGSHASWKPLSSNYESYGVTSRTFYQILAFGCEEGVDQQFYRELSAQVERSWLDTTHGSRTSLVDIRDLIIKVMQTFTSQALYLQAGENPFSRPSLLASLLIPHLEPYLSSGNSPCLIILQYPASHLSTIFALRELVGSELLKIAGIVDTDAIASPRSARERTFSIASSIYEFPAPGTGSLSPGPDTGNVGTSQTFAETNQQVSFSKANFVLPSPATDPEISSFLISVNDSLIKDYFVDSTDVRPPPEEQFPAASPTSASSSSSSTYPPTPPSKDPPIPFKPQIDPLFHMRAPSYLTSISSSDITALTRGKARDENRSVQDWENFYIGSDTDEEKELEGFSIPRLSKGYGNSEKAFKWLGLS